MATELPPFWSNVIREFHRSARARKALLKSTSAEQLVDAMVSTLAGEHAPALKCSVLLFVGQASAQLLESEAQVQRVCGALSKLLSTGAEACVQCQALVTLTDVVCVTAAPGSSVLHSFVELLYERVQQQHAPLVRALAAECLQELETCFPRLLQEGAGSLAVLAQTDSSLALQSLSGLLLECVGHALVPGKPKKRKKKKKRPEGGGKKKRPKKKKPKKTKSSTNLRKLSQGLGFLTPSPLLPLQLPENVSAQAAPLRFDDAPAATDQLQERSRAELKKLFAMVAADSSSLFCAPARLQTVAALLALAKRCGEAAPLELFKQHFCSFSSSNSPVLLHALLLVRREGLLTPALDEALVGRLLSCADDESLPPEMRALCAAWLSELPAWCGLDASLMYSAYPRLLPTAFDPVSVKHAKLCSLVSCFSEERPPPERLLGVLVCLDEFKWHRSSDSVARVAFGVLSKFLSALPGKFPEVYGYLLDTLVSHPRFLANIVTMLDQMENERITTQLLLNFNDLFATLSPQQLLEYLPLIERVVRAPDVDPVALVQALERAARETSLCAGSWHAGDALVSVCREAMVHYCSGGRALYKCLSELLFYLSQYFSDVELRDRAHFYYFLLTHLPPGQLLHVLTDPPPSEATVTGGPARPRAGTGLEHEEEQEEDDDDESNRSTQNPFMRLVRQGAAQPLADGAELEIPVMLTYANEGGPESVAAVSLAFSEHTELMEPIQQLSAAYLAAPPAGTVVNVTEAPYVAHALLRLKPKLPVPVSLAVRALYTRADATDEQLQLEPFALRLEDFFGPAPDASAERWQQLWEQPEMHEAVHALQEPRQQLLDRLQPKLGAHEVAEGRYLVCLAPRFVLLVHVQESENDLPRMQGQHSLVRFKTDAPPRVASAYGHILEA